MATIHFLNVKQGDCSVIKHNSGHVTVIDVCNAKPTDVQTEKLITEMAKLVTKRKRYSQPEKMAISVGDGIILNLYFSKPKNSHKKAISRNSSRCKFS